MFERLPLISTRPELAETVATLIGESAELIVVDGPDEVSEFLLLEMPPVYLIDVSDPAFDAFVLLDEIMADGWLMQGSMIAIYKEAEAGRRVTDLQGSSLIMALAEKELERDLRKILKVVRDNARLAVQRGLGSSLSYDLSASVELRNDPVEANCHISLVCNFLYNAGRMSAQQKPRLRMVLQELLMNAIEHGNCGIDHARKTAWLEAGGEMQELIAREASDPANRNKTVRFEYELHFDRANFRITDAGPGFNWRRCLQPDASADTLALHGRGIQMSLSCAPNLEYNEIGNSVYFEFDLEAPEQPSAGGLFQDNRPQAVEPGDFVIRQGQPSEHIYFIVRGEFDVLYNSRVVGELTADDFVFGEMSFLLGQWHRADVVARTPGSVITIGRRDFVRAIHTHPHYGVFLSRMLASRIERLNQKLIGAAQLPFQRRKTGT